ncbi:Polynucleotide adenylyltransferase [Lachancea thermotolerans]
MGAKEASKNERAGPKSSSKSKPLKDNQRRTKRLRKSSLSKAQRNFAVFNKDGAHINKYENLELDNIESEGDDGSERTQESSEAPTTEATPESEEPQKEQAQDNALDDNQDYISLSMSSEEEQESEEEAPDEAGGEHPGGDAAQPRTLNTDYPWILNHDHSKQREIADWLTLEIKDFVAYISPSQEEIRVRNSTISKIRNAVKDLWPDADLHVFGSFATDLYLPGSDIDCVVNSSSGDKENRNCLYSLASFLKRRKLATQVEVISKARVPIIKFVEPISQIHIDISFERVNGLEAARVIRGWLKETPGLRELVLIVKQFLAARRLNMVHTGGLGGFSIICLVYAFLQLHPRVISSDIDSMENLGILLIDFFELYGKNFGYDHVAISVTDSGARYLSKELYGSLQNPRTSFALAIQDPGDKDNNISRGSFNIRDIKKAFAGAFDLLTNRCFELDAATFKDRVGKSILGNVIKYRGKQRDFKDERNLVVNKAIAENETYHRKRGRIVHEEVFTDVSDGEKEDDIYTVEEPAKKKPKKAKKAKKAKKETKASSSSVDTLMGLDTQDDADEDGYDPSNEAPSTLALEDARSDIRKKSVDAQTKRDYWLSKGQAL